MASLIGGFGLDAVTPVADHNVYGNKFCHFIHLGCQYIYRYRVDSG